MDAIAPGNSKLGFVGIGYMGRPIAQRLLQAGFSLTAYDRTRSKAEGLIPYGATVANDIAGAASGCEVLLSCLANDEAVLNVYLGPGGVLSKLSPGSLALEMSTVSPEIARRIAQEAAQHAVSVLDVTISGSTPAAEQGALVLFGGGDEKRFDACAAIFRAISRSHFYMGPNGCGASMKLVVNTLLGVGMQAIAEAVALGEKAGLQRNRLCNVLAQTAVVAPAHVGKLQRAIVADYNPQFPLRLMNKDFKLILGLAALLQAQMPTAEAAFEVNARRLEQGKEEDFSAVILEMEQQDHLAPVEGNK